MDSSPERPPTLPAFDSFPKESESLLYTLVTASPLAILVLDLQERVQLWNPSAERMFGWTAGEVLGHVSTIVPPEKRGEAQQILQQVLRGESVTEREFLCLRRDGTRIHAGFAAARVCDESGTPQGVMIIAGDITDRRRLEAERGELLRQAQEAREQAESAEQRARLLADAGTLLDSSLDYHVMLRNLAAHIVPTLADFCLVDELEGEELRRVATAHADPEREWWVEQFQVPSRHTSEEHPVVRMLRTGESVLWESMSEESIESVGRSDPQLRELLRVLAPTSLVTVPLVARGRTLGALTLAVAAPRQPFTPADVEVAEELARRAGSAIDTARLYHQARQAVQARERVLAVVSHDLRNSLATILLNASAMLDSPSTDEVLRETEREQLRWIARSTEQMSRLIDDLLDVSTIEAGRLSIEPSVYEVAPLLRDSLYLCRPLAEERQLRMGSVVAVETPPVRVDYERIQQVLSNLLGNAIKFSPSSSEIVIRAQPHGRHEVRISVTDQGPGIEHEHQHSVFELFWQGRRGRKMGAGLGLAIAKGIVQAHGGRIWVESRPGAGSTFCFTVPAATGPAEEAAHPSDTTVRTDG